jgi:hypothetical protein
LTQNTWIHVALTRNGNTFTMWVNGQSDGTNTISATMIYYPPVIGRVQGLGVEYFNGYLDDFRITKGIARYTSNFTPPTAELPDPSDPDFDSVSLLLHGDGTNGSTTFIDSSSNSHTVTPSGNAQISTTQSKFGGASIKFDGSGDYLTIPGSSEFSPGSGDFTAETWFYLDANPGLSLQYYRRILLSSYSYSGGSITGFTLQLRGTQTAYTFITANDGDTVVSDASVTVSQNVWHHVAFTKSGSDCRIFFNGSQVGATGTYSTFADSSANPLYVGRLNLSTTTGWDFSGYIDDLRITKGVARYTSSFTPPTAPFPND